MWLVRRDKAFVKDTVSAAQYDASKLPPFTREICLAFAWRHIHQTGRGANWNARDVEEYRDALNLDYNVLINRAKTEMDGEARLYWDCCSKGYTFLIGTIMPVCLTLLPTSTYGSLP